VSVLEENGCSKFFLRFLGSVEVNYHKGDEILCQAINKVGLPGTGARGLRICSLKCRNIVEVLCHYKNIENRLLYDIFFFGMYRLCPRKLLVLKTIIMLHVSSLIKRPMLYGIGPYRVCMLDVLIYGIGPHRDLHVRCPDIWHRASPGSTC